MIDSNGNDGSNDDGDGGSNSNNEMKTRKNCLRSISAAITMATAAVIIIMMWVNFNRLGTQAIHSRCFDIRNHTHTHTHIESH